MKNAHLPLLSIALVLLLASCEKDDIQANEDQMTTETVAAAAGASDGWVAPDQWQTADQQTFSVHYATIEDPAITSDVADKGLVLVFKKNGASVNALPFEETAAATTKASDAENANANYWYHQVSEGNLLISCDMYQTAADAANRFKYFVISPEKLQSLEKDGYTTEKLMNLSYEAAATLLASEK